MLSRRYFCAAGLAVTAAAGRAAELPDITVAQDFDELWRTLDERYCFFADKATDWPRVRAMYRPLALAAESTAAFADVVRRVLAELYDAHTHLSEPADGMPRWPPYDLLVERDHGAVRVVAVNAGSAAGDAGLRPGDRILAVGRQPIDAAARALGPKCLARPDPAADAYAINVAVAGRRAEPRVLTVASGNAAPREVALPLKTHAPLPDLDSRRLERGIGYIAIRSFADTAIVAAFDSALAAFRDAPALIIDVRGNGGGDTTVARPIMGRFITEARAYATMRRRSGPGLGPAWTETVEPRGPFTFTRPVIVLADHWSGSMAEGFPMGMRAVARARIVGTPMMGLGAAVFGLRLDRTGIAAQYSGEPVYTVTGAPRWLLQPDVLVEGGGDILAAGIAVLNAPHTAAP